jgi:hypothetical protein
MMKRQILSTLVTGLLLALIVATPARAQLPGTSVRVNIPFDFIIRGRTLPAGTYEVRTISDSVEGLIIRNVSDHHDHIMFETERLDVAKAPNRSEIVFHRYGDSYFLSEILTAGEETGSEVIPSRAERQLMRELKNNQTASNKTEPETVVLAVY